MRLILESSISRDNLKNREELFQFLNTERQTIPQNIFDNLVSSMDRRDAKQSLILEVDTAEIETPFWTNSVVALVKCLNNDQILFNSAT